MINSLIAYNIAELEKHKVVSKARDLNQAKIITNEQLEQIKKAYSPDLYIPSIFMRILLFIFSLIGMITFMGPAMLLFSNLEESGIRIFSILWGGFLLFLTEKVCIKDKQHYNSGVTEAGIYSSLSFIALGILGTNSQVLVVYAIVGFVLTAFAAIRYLNLTALILTVGFLTWIIFEILTTIGGTIETLMPFLFMVTFALIYIGSKKLQKKQTRVIFENQFIALKTLSLVLFYLAGNYFVVRELSVSLMNLDLSSQNDIPFAILFYLLTALIPIGYIYWGIKQRSVLALRVGMLTVTLSVVTFKYYFSLGLPVVTLTISGAVLIVIALFLFNYLKQIRGGFTREILLHDKWVSSNLTAFIASQTLGGNKAAGKNDGPAFGGGKFGGAGAGENW